MTGEAFLKQSDLFDNYVYIPEICDVINIALAELPALLSVQDMAKMLLRLRLFTYVFSCVASDR